MWAPEKHLNTQNKVAIAHFKNIQRKIAYDESDGYFEITNDSDILETKKSIITQIKETKQERKDFLKNAKNKWSQNTMEIKEKTWEFRNIIQQFKGWFKSKWFNH